MRVVPRTLRGRITMLSAAISAVVLIAVAVLILVVQRQQLLNNLDDALEREADAVVATLNADSSIALDRTGDDRFIQVVAGNGRVLTASSPRLLDQPVLPIIGTSRRFETLSSVPLEDDEFRVLAQQAELGSDDVTVIVGENTDDLRDSLRGLTATLAVVIPLTIVVLAALAWLIARRTLAPVKAIQDEVEMITLNRLSDRVGVPEAGDEIAELAVTMNAMLDRLDRANEQQKRFVADASHELRSPLTRLRTSLEVDLDSESRDLNVTGTELLGDIEDLQRLIEDLLFLARNDSEAASALAPTDLDAIVDRAVARPTESVAPIRIDTTAVEPVEIVGNERQLERLIANVLSNAVRHASTTVWVEVFESSGTATVAIEDDGPGIDIADRERIFDRFVRLDESRTGGTGGTGLGLAIARDIAHGHNGTIHVEDGRTGGARLRISLPTRLPPTTAAAQ